MKYRRQIRPNVWYIVTPDPTQRDNPEAWSVVIEGGKYDRIAGKFADISITDKGKTINYRFHTKWIPPEFDEHEWEEERFTRLMEDIFVDFLRFAHKNGMMKYTPMTEKEKDEGLYTRVEHFEQPDTKGTGMYYEGDTGE